MLPSPLQPDVGSHSPPPFGAQRAWCPPPLVLSSAVSSSDTICNSPSPPLVDIVLFGLSLSDFPSRFFKMHLLGRGFHTLIKNIPFILILSMIRGFQCWCHYHIVLYSLLNENLKHNHYVRRSLNPTCSSILSICRHMSNS